MHLFRPFLYEPTLPMKLSKSESSRCKRDTKGDGRQPEAGLQRRPDLPRSRLRRRPDGQEDVSRTKCELFPSSSYRNRARSQCAVHSFGDDLGGICERHTGASVDGLRQKIWYSPPVCKDWWAVSFQYYLTHRMSPVLIGYSNFRRF